MQGRNPTRREKIMLQRLNLNPQNWLVVKSPPGEMHISHRHTSTKRVIKGRLLERSVCDGGYKKYA